MKRIRRQPFHLVAQSLESGRVSSGATTHVEYRGDTLREQVGECFGVTLLCDSEAREGQFLACPETIVHVLKAEHVDVEPIPEVLLLLRGIPLGMET